MSLALLFSFLGSLNLDVYDMITMYEVIEVS